MRLGHSLVEALCALALSGVLAAVALGTLRVARASAAGAERLERGLRAEREAVAVLAAALRSGGPPTLRGDTAVELDVLLGVSVACAHEPMAIVLPPARFADGALTVLSADPAADDLVGLRLSASADAWWFSAIDSVALAPLGTCGVSTGFQSGPEQRPLRVVLQDSVPADIASGDELRLLRRARFALYHAGSGDWMLGYRRCHPYLELCGVIQPVVGPLRTPAAGGLRLRWQEASSRFELSARGVGGLGAKAWVH